MIRRLILSCRIFAPFEDKFAGKGISFLNKLDGNNFHVVSAPIPLLMSTSVGQSVVLYPCRSILELLTVLALTEHIL